MFRGCATYIKTTSTRMERPEPLQSFQKLPLLTTLSLKTAENNAELRRSIHPIVRRRGGIMRHFVQGTRTTQVKSRLLQEKDGISFWLLRFPADCSSSALDYRDEVALP
jgi:hypothetical protein